MKTLLKLSAFALVSAFIIHTSSFGQGVLTPPGAPAATMKSLAQIEPRTAITNTASLVTITQPGSYYLTGNLTVSSGDGIVIATNCVTLDLNGFTISSTAASAAGYGIKLTNAPSDITICNGHIRSGVTNNGSGVYSGSGFGYGLAFSVGIPANVLVSRVSVAGCLYGSIYLNNGNSTLVESCTVQTVGSVGIVASTIKQSTARDCAITGIIGDQVADCRGESTGSGGYGVYASYTAQNCYGYSSGNGYGLVAATALNCYGQSSSGYGLVANFIAQNCFGDSSSGYGLYASVTAQNCYGYSSGNDYGLYADNTAQNCFGVSNSGIGLFTTTAQNCYGVSSTGTGLYAIKTANGCYGNSGSGTGLNAFIANSCSGTSLSVTHNLNSY